MKKYSRNIVFIFFIQLFSLGVYAQCGLYEVYLDQKVNESECIIEAEVIQQQSFKSTNKNKIYTINVVKVFSVLKGSVPQQINIITAGGTVGNQMELASSLLRLKKGQIGMFFLNKDTILAMPFQTDVYSVFASSQGFYKYNLPEKVITNIYDNFSDQEFYKLLEEEYNLTVRQLYSPLVWGENSSINRLTVINNFSPLTINAGIGDQITINGFGFGNSRGESKVLFKNANDGGLTEIEAEPSQYISWADNKIVVAISHQAGTGKIAVIVGGSRAQSSATLQINFAIINTGSQNLVNPSRHVARNANKGYIWSMNSEFDSDSVAKSNFLVSFKKWRCKTYINWTIGNNTSINYSERDTLSVISFDENNELPVGVLGLCYSYYSGCSEDDWYIEEQDMLFRKSDKWHFGDQTIPGNKIDFQTVALHELGHAHQLAHVINTSDLMHYSINNGEQRRTIENINLTAAQWMMNKSQESDICDKKRMQLLDAELCNDENFGFFNTLIYPNPFIDFLNIDFYLNKNDKLKVSLFDITGKLVMLYENENSGKGYFPLVFNAHNHQIGAGVYILKVEIGSEKTVKKLVKL